MSKTITVLKVQDTKLPPESDVVDFIILASADEQIQFTYNSTMITIAELATHLDNQYTTDAMTDASVFGRFLEAFIENDQIIFNRAANTIPSIGSYILTIETKTLDYYSLT